MLTAARLFRRIAEPEAMCPLMDGAIHLPLMAVALGAVYTLGGRVADAVPLVTRALEHTTATERVSYQVLCRPSLREAQLPASCPEEAYALRLLGEIEARREPPEREHVEAYHQKALALADELGMRPLMTHCHHSLGTLYAVAGRREQARAELSIAIEPYKAMEMTFWQPRVEAALAQVEGSMG